MDFSKGTVDDKGTSPNGFTNMLDEIRLLFSRPDNKVDVDELWSVLEKYKSDPNDWSKYAFYEKRRYKRNFIDGNDRYNVMILSWAPGIKSCIHDHPDAHCFMKVLDGELIESRYAWPTKTSNSDKENGREMHLVSEGRAKTDDILYIHDRFGLHCVENASQTKSCASLHIYCPPFRMCKAFDRSTGASKICHLSFHSERGRLLSRQCEDDVEQVPATDSPAA